MNSSFTQPYTSPTNTSSAVPASSDPMDLDAFKTRDQQREEERRLGLCHYCKKPGHSVWDCDAKKQADTQRAARGGPGFAGSRGGFGGHGSYRGAPPVEAINTLINTLTIVVDLTIEIISRNTVLGGFVETESLAPSESASNTSPHNTSTSPINDYTGKAQPPH
ncbi:hypothetical protein DID88_010022 [Monilinia fructigena]|uniref:CCHC-type domain-containing protein n=1 Tax=Monilinia fructigena TaxID=38457 RepID=A0A395ILF7_9HELO|nr:hypothetical protein DID88_010022 [Monilinia fructigena]